ncbi:MAG: DUF4268 domain-containing protein [Phycisphaerales bacterium]
MTIGKINRIPLRDVWKHEAHDFTTWLEQNIDVLNEIIEPNLTIVDRESSAGDFKLDLLAEDDQNQTVVIENQLERSDHDHLGKVLTYLAAFDAKIAIWIVGHPRPEHVSAVSWLNESNTAAAFYLIKAEAVSIGDSPPALLLTAIVSPSDESKIVAHEKKQLSERHHLRQEFWTALLEQAKDITNLHSNISPSNQNWISASAGTTGTSFAYVITQKWWRVELYIDRGKNSNQENQRIFDLIHEQSDSIEANFGDKISWERLDEKRACRVSSKRNSGGYKSSIDQWPEIHAQMIDSMIRLENAVRKPLEDALKASSVFKVG